MVMQITGITKTCALQAVFVCELRGVEEAVLSCFVLLSIFFPLLCFPVGSVFLDTIAPNEQEASNRLGVFAEGQNVSSLLQPGKLFLPTCFHTLANVRLTLELSKTDGDLWFRVENVPTFPGRLVPLQPQHLLPNLTGHYRCRSPGRQLMVGEYHLEVVGKMKTRLCVKLSTLAKYLTYCQQCNDTCLR